MVVFAGRAEAARGVDDLVAAFPLLLERVPRAATATVVAARSGSRALGACAGDDTVGGRDRSAPLPISMRRCRRVRSVRFRSVGPSTMTPTLAAAEAMALGLPIVATTVDCLAPLVQPGVNGMLVPPHDPAALAGALARVLCRAGDVGSAVGRRPQVDRGALVLDRGRRRHQRCVHACDRTKAGFDDRTACRTRDLRRSDAQHDAHAGRVPATASVRSTTATRADRGRQRLRRRHRSRSRVVRRSRPLPRTGTLGAAQRRRPPLQPGTVLVFADADMVFDSEVAGDVHALLGPDGDRDVCGGRRARARIRDRLPGALPRAREGALHRGSRGRRRPGLSGGGLRTDRWVRRDLHRRRGLGPFRPHDRGWSHGEDPQPGVARRGSHQSPRGVRQEALLRTRPRARTSRRPPRRAFPAPRCESPPDGSAGPTSPPDSRCSSRSSSPAPPSACSRRACVASHDHVLRSPCARRSFDGWAQHFDDFARTTRHCIRRRRDSSHFGCERAARRVRRAGAARDADRLGRVDVLDAGAGTGHVGACPRRVRVLCHGSRHLGGDAGAARDRSSEPDDRCGPRSVHALPFCRTRPSTRWCACAC